MVVKRPSLVCRYDKRLLTCIHVLCKQQTALVASPPASTTSRVQPATVANDELAARRIEQQLLQSALAQSEREHLERVAREQQERQQQQQHEKAEREERERAHLERESRDQQQERDEQQRLLAGLDRTGTSSPCEVSSDLVKNITNDFNDERKLGEGAFGDVFEGVVEDVVNQRQVRVAVKRLKPSIRLQGDEAEHRAAVSSIRREIHVLSNFSHPNIIRLLGFTSTSAGVAQELCLVYELGQYGSLDKMLQDDERFVSSLCSSSSSVFLLMFYSSKVLC
jgi:hypothetical protein